MKSILALLAFVPALALASSGGVPLDKAPIDIHNKASLQRGAAIFINHCLNCHQAAVMRYRRLEDLGLSEQQIKENLLFAGEKVGDAMTTALDPTIGKAAFGGMPPDLTLVARSRGADWLYTYLRSFYRDPNSKTGWNNTVFPNVAMPHVLWEYQGVQEMQVTERMDEHTGDKVVTRKLVMARPGTLSKPAYEQYTADLVNYLSYMGEPAQGHRKLWGILVMFFLAGFFILMLMLKKEYWKDVK
jgi:ubiquinol-cytochrome c reductase cytochrome c1 subunit